MFLDEMCLDEDRLVESGADYLKPPYELYP